MKTILVIDDTPEVLEIITDTLRFADFNVLSAGDGMSGVQLAQTHLPDLILCDINMPNLDGFGTLEMLRKESLTAVIPFIFLTGASDKIHFRRGMELGADDFLSKPFNAAELMGAVSTRLTKHETFQRRSEKKLEELRGNISLALPHELRTPLNGILGLSSILMEDHRTMRPQEIFETAKFINEAALRLHRIIENFLVYAQIELVAADPERVAAFRQVEAIPVGDFIVVIAREQANKARRETDLDVKITTASVSISQEHLKKIVEELVENAFKFSEPGSRVQVFTQVTDNSFNLHVLDNGRGMSAEQIASIGAHMQFERKFYEQQGAGLGLFIARRLSELYGGQLAIESVPGQRTLVRVVFPLAK
jgi:two-component system sensor histidine kinase/response regulator